MKGFARVELPYQSALMTKLDSVFFNIFWSNTWFTLVVYFYYIRQYFSMLPLSFIFWSY